MYKYNRTIEKYFKKLYPDVIKNIYDIICIDSYIVIIDKRDIEKCSERDLQMKLFIELNR